MIKPDITGHYQVAGTAFSIVDHDDQLFMAQPEVPDDYRPTLDWTGPEALAITSGPFSGAEIGLEVADGAVIGGLVGGVIPFEKTGEPPSPTPGSGLRAPPYRPDAVRDAEFSHCWGNRASDRPLAAPYAYPAHSFVQWLMGGEQFIFHGSNRTDIDEFQPRRESMELFNQGGHGNLGAVYGTHDGLWALFFSVVDRSQLRGSIRNGIGTYTSETGASLPLYNFSIEQQSLSERPFTSGALYVLPRDRFERIPMYPGGPPTNEWACFEPVRPLAMIPVDQEDFPFLDQVGGHDDGELMRLSEVADQVFEHVDRASLITDGVRLTFDDDLDPAARDEWIELGRRFYPDVTRTLVDELTVDLSGPPAFVHGIQEQLADRIED